MNTGEDPDAIVVGSGPNGLAAAITLARAGLRVLVLEANHTIGGGARSAELTLPGFTHDICSAIHPLALASPFFRQLPLHHYGLDWVHAPLPLGHPLDDGSSGVLKPSVRLTAQALGADGNAYERLMLPLVLRWKELVDDILRPPLHLPKHPWALAQFGYRSMKSAARLARNRFTNEPAKALFAGLSAHSFLPLEKIPSAAFGLILGLIGHALVWPMPRGGARRKSPMHW
jgi:phytoene dehydrogenase-like protein